MGARAPCAPRRAHAPHWSAWAWRARHSRAR